MVSLFNTGDFIRQRTFRMILEAMARPGRIFRLPAASHRQDGFAYLLLVLETLLDQEATHFVIESKGSMELEGEVFEMTKSPPVPLEEADFIIAPQGSTGESLNRAKRGLPDYPDLSAMVVYLVYSLSEGRETSGPAILQGPGIAESRVLPVMEGFDYRDLRQLSSVNQEFPLGIEALFVDLMGNLTAIPRSTQIQLKEAQWPM